MSKIITINPKEVPAAKVQGYLQAAIAPRPIAFASTISKDGLPNLSPFSFFNVFSSNPPVLVFSPARRVRNNTIKHTLINCQDTKEVVINVVNYAIVEQMSLSSTEYPDGVNEFEKAGLTMVKSDLVKPFRVAESPVQFECKINDIIALGAEGGAGNLIICEVVKIHIDEAILNKDGVIDPYKIDLVARCGGNWYTRAKEGFFEIEKPLSTLGIGVDNVPNFVKEHPLFTGNDLGKLGNIEVIPTAEEVEAFTRENFSIKAVLSADDDDKKMELAKKYLDNNEVLNAWKTLLAKQ